MARPSLKAGEVALIKAMLNRGMRNNEIQFLFNRPDRPVNNGRISEIKGGVKWAEVQPATSEEVDEFLAQVDETELPDQLSDAARFMLNNEGRIALEPDPPTVAPEANLEQIEVYNELRSKTVDLMANGHNVLGQLNDPLDAFEGVLPPDISDASITRIWLKGNKLRSVLRAHDEVKDLTDGGHPAEIDRASAELLRDIIETFNLFIVVDPKGAELDRRRLGPDDRFAAAEELELAKPIVETAGEIATDETMDVLGEQLDAAVDAPETLDGDQAVSLARDTFSNLVIALVRSGFATTRRILGAEFQELWQKFKGGLYTTLGAAAGAPIVVYMANQAGALTAYAETAINNPMVMQIIEFISRLFG